MKKAHIFVQCASYRDPALRYTIRTAFENAVRPNRIAFGICWQGHLNELQKHLATKYFNKQRVVLIKAEETLGIGYARHKAQSMFEGEEYTLQIDSHMKFLPRWDEKCLNLLRQCPSDKPLLTGYLSDFSKDEEPMCYRLGATQFVGNTKNVTIMGVRGTVGDKKPRLGILASAHFVFSKSELYDDCPIDPRMQFLYEETLIAPRAYTHGWDIYHPHIAPLQHRWNRSYRRTTWQDFNTAPLENKGAKIYQKVISGKDKSYGMGIARSLEDFGRYSGINFKQQTLTRKAKNGIPNLSRV